VCGEGVVVVGSERVSVRRRFVGAGKEKGESDTHATRTGFARAGRGSYGWPC
jgi:hypothetical protein